MQFVPELICHDGAQRVQQVASWTLHLVPVEDCSGLVCHEGPAPTHYDGQTDGLQDRHGICFVPGVVWTGFAFVVSTAAPPPLPWMRPALNK